MRDGLAGFGPARTRHYETLTRESSFPGGTARIGTVLDSSVAFLRRVDQAANTIASSDEPRRLNELATALTSNDRTDWLRKFSANYNPHTSEPLWGHDYWTTLGELVRECRALTEDQRRSLPDTVSEDVAALAQLPALTGEVMQADTHEPALPPITPINAALEDKPVSLVNRTRPAPDIPTPPELTWPTLGTAFRKFLGHDSRSQEHPGIQAFRRLFNEPLGPGR